MFEVAPLMPVGADCCFTAGQGANQRTIFLASAIHETLRADAVDALRSLPRRGLEIGGILLGQFEEPIAVNSLAPIESEHLYGPRYRQSDRDRQVFWSKIRELRAIPDRENQPVGLYRTYTREGDDADVRDVEWFQEYFSDRDAIFLLILPKLTGRAVISCFYWDRSALVPCHLTGGDTPSHHEPVARKILSIESRPHERQVQPVPEAAPPKPVSRVNRQPARPGRAARWFQEAAIAAVAALLVSAGIFFFHHEPASARVNTTAKPASVVPPAERPLGLHLELTKAGTKVIWNEKSEQLKDAPGALLSVEDGPSRIDIPISLAELQTGYLLYGRAKPQTKFSLTVYSADGSEVRESVQAPGPATAKAASRSSRAAVRPLPKGENGSVSSPALTLPKPVTSDSGSLFSKP